MDRRIAALFAASFAVFMLAFVLRHYYFGISEIVGTPTFYHTRIAESILDGVYYDDLSFGGRPLTYAPLFPLFHALSAAAFGLNLGGMLFVALSGAAGMCFSYAFLKKYIRNGVSILVLLLLPGTVFLYSHISTRAVPITLGIASLYLLSERRHFISGIMLGISYLFHPEAGAVFSIIVALYILLERKESPKNIAKIALPAAIIALVWYAPFIVQNGLPEYNLLHGEYRERRYSLESPSAENFLWELGKGYLTVPVLALSVIGLYYSRNNFFRLWFVFCLVLALAAERFFFYLLFPASFISSFGIEKIKSLVKRKHIYVIIIASILVYSAYFGLSRSAALAEDYPIRQQIDAFHWIRDNTPPDAVILSDWQWGHWISGIAKRRNFVDGYAEYAPSVNKRISELREFYATCRIPEGYGISYVYMEDWFAGKYGISCLGEFEKVYDNAGISIYKAS
ncbi:MAG: hypothetical protein HYW27_04425 [Candidatus Aenigmarchaeota archaeon]|nr:hypothetical protein [Candidatus Aenigmarchaeota archaeon]